MTLKAGSRCGVSGGYVALVNLFKLIVGRKGIPKGCVRGRS